MSTESSGLFTVKDINRIKTLQDVIDRWLTPGRAAEHLGITPRHCSRLLKRYREHGPLGINNRSRGNPGNRLLPRGFTDQALEIIRKNYPDFGPTLAREKLEEIHGLGYVEFGTYSKAPHHKNISRIRLPLLFKQLNVLSNPPSYTVLKGSGNNQ